MREFVAWEVKVIYTNYAQARALYKIACVLEHERAEFTAIDSEGEPFVDVDDEALIGDG